MQQATGSNLHVAVLAFPFGSHAAPLLSITRRLATTAPNTLFSFFTTAQTNSSVFQHHRMPPNVKAYNVSDGVPEGHVFVGNMNPLVQKVELFMKVAYENFKKEMEVATAETGRKVSCFVTDAFFCFGKEMAEEIGVPWVAFYIAGASSLFSHLHTDLIREKFGDGGGGRGNIGREDETLSFIPGMSTIRIRDLPEEILLGNKESIFCRMLHQIEIKLPQATAVLVNSFEELEPIITNDIKSKLKNFLCIGPFILSIPPTLPASSDTYACLPWLDKQNPGSVVYISFGSIATPTPDEFVAIAEALEASKVPFIWSLRDQSKEHLPDGFIDRAKHGMLVPWAPQIDVLAHASVGAFLSQGGWNSITESIVCGVPLILRPYLGEQKFNARMVEAVWGIGVTVEGWIFTMNGLLSSLDLVLKQEKGKKLKANVKALKELAEGAVGVEGSTTKNFKILLDIVS